MVRRFIAPTTIFCVMFASSAFAQGEDRAEPGQGRTGRMITLRGRIDSALKDRVLEAAQRAAKDGVDVVIFDIQAAPSDFGSSSDLAFAIADLGVRRTVAYVNGVLTGHAVMVALACDEIVMNPEAKIGDVYRDGRPRRPEIEAANYQRLARDKGHDPIIPLGMLDDSLVIHEVRTAAGRRFVDRKNLDEFRRTNRVLGEEVVKEAGSPLLLTAATAERFGLVQRTAESRREVALMYELPEQIAAEDALFTEAYRPILLKLDGSIDNRLYEYVRRRLRHAHNQGHNLLFVQIDSSHGDETAASNIANALSAYGQDARVVAWVPRQATGAAVMLLFACDELVMARDATIGSFRPASSKAEDAKILAGSAVQWAQGSRYPEAIVRGFMDPNVAVYQMQSKTNPGSRMFVTGDMLEQPEIVEQWHNPRPIKDAEVVMQMDGEKARSLDVAFAAASNLEELQSVYNHQARIPVLQPGWIDAMIQALTSTGGTFFLLFLGIICLYLEFQIPGFGVAGLLSAACFALFFWSRFLVDQAHSLEIVLFLLGVLFLAIELFVLPGFGFAGISGLLLIVSSLILSTQSFTIPTNADETREFAVNVITMATVLLMSLAAILGLSRYFPRMPLLNRMILGPPEATEPEAEMAAAEVQVSPYDDLLGRQGVAASPLRPSGRMQFAGKFYDVVAHGEFVEAGHPVEVIEVSQNRIVVRDATSD